MGFLLQDLPNNVASSLSLLLLSSFLFYQAGRLRGVFECILVFDSVKWWSGLRYSRAAFEQSKDTNYDGKVSYWERTFPKDGGHRSKLWEVILIAMGISVTMYSYVYLILYLAETDCDACYYVAWLWPAIMTPLYFIVFSAGFLHSFKHYRKDPPEIHSDYQEPTQFIH